MKNCMHRLIKLLTGSALVLVLAACGSSPPVHYFALNSLEGEQIPDVDDAVLLALGPIGVPDYLNRTHIVTRGANAEIMVDQSNRWAEPLSISVKRILAADVDKLLDRVVVITFPVETAALQHIDYRLTGELNRFDADANGRVVLEVQWGVTDRDLDEVLIPISRSRYVTQAAEPVDINTKVAAMNEALSQYGRDIADRLSTALTR